MREETLGGMHILVKRHQRHQQQTIPIPSHNKSKRKRKDNNIMERRIHREGQRYQPPSFLMGIIFFFLFLLFQPSHAAVSLSVVETGNRVAEQLQTILQTPMNALGVLAQYRRLQGFAHDLQAPDRSIALSYLYSWAVQNALNVYYGMENGLFLFYNAQFSSASYREPAQSGYPLNNDTTSLSSLLYGQACVNAQTGQVETCQIEADDRPLIVCASPNCDTYQPCGNGNTGEEEAWCLDYTTETVTADYLGNRQLGYVPRTYSCIDQQGQLTEALGQAIQSTQVVNGTQYSVLSLSDCTFGNGETLVQRSHIAGPYALCGGNSSICNNIFTGGFQSRDYDPRVRGWYQQVKAAQTQTWSDPYPFFTNLQMGITYGHPLYSIQDNNDGRIIFDGVLAVDYPLTGISRFLQQEYPSSNKVLIAIVEDGTKDNYYLIASSTGKSPAKLVLASDPSQPCPTTTTTSSSDCMAVRVSIVRESDDWTTSSPQNALLYQAFQVQLAQGFPPQELLPLADDTYVSTTIPYIQQGSTNLQWRILIAVPTVAASDDAVTAGTALLPIIIVLACLGFFLCMALFGSFWNWRKEKAMIHADWRFTLAFILGCAVLNLTSFALLGPTTNALCLLRPWTFHTLFATAFAPLLVKVWRMYSLIGKSSGFTRVSISNLRAALYTLPIIGTQVVILLIFTFVDPPLATSSLSTDGLDTTVSVTCERDTVAFLVTQIVFDASLVLAGCALAYLTRNLDPKFGEAKQLIFAMYNIGFTAVIALLISQFVPLGQAGEYAIQAIGVFWATLFSSSAFVLPRLMQVQKSRRFLEEARRSSSGDPSQMGGGGGGPYASRYGGASRYSMGPNVRISGLDFDVSQYRASTIGRRTSFESAPDSGSNVMSSSDGGMGSSTLTPVADNTRTSASGPMLVPLTMKELSDLIEESQTSELEPVSTAEDVVVASPEVGPSSPPTLVPLQSPEGEDEKKISNNNNKRSSLRSSTSSRFSLGSRRSSQRTNRSSKSQRVLSDVELAVELEKSISMGDLFVQVKDVKNDVSSSDDDDDDYDRGGPQWAGRPDLNEELNRSVRLSTNSLPQYSSSSFSVGLEGPSINRRNSEQTEPLKNKSPSTSSSSLNTRSTSRKLRPFRGSNASDNAEDSFATAGRSGFGSTTLESVDEGAGEGILLEESEASSSQDASRQDKGTETATTEPTTCSTATTTTLAEGSGSGDFV